VFLDKASAYILWYNVARKNKSKNCKSPWDIIAERNKKILASVVALLPVFLDQLWKTKPKLCIRDNTIFVTLLCH